MEEQELRGEQTSQITLSSLLAELRNNLILIIVITLVMTVLGGLFGALFVKTKYSSSAALVVSPPSASSSSGGSNSDLSYAVNLTNSFKDFFKSDFVSKDAAAKYNATAAEKVTAGQIKSGITTTTNTQSFIINVSFTSNNKDAQNILNQIIESAISLADSTVVDAGGNEKPVYGLFYEKLTVMNYAGGVSSDSFSKVVKYLALFFAGGLVVSFVIIVLKLILNDTYKTKESLENDVPVEVLAMIEDITLAKEEK